MSNLAMMVLTPILIVVVLALFRFTGCTSFSAAEIPENPKAVPGPPLVVAPPDKPPPPTMAKYQDIVTATAGFAALWPLNETGGNVANAVGPLSATAQGTYISRSGAPAGSGYNIGLAGVLSPKEAGDFAPEFDGTVAYIDVPFNAPLNPAKMAGFTVEVWIKPNPAATSPQIVISSHRNDSAGAQQGYEIVLTKDPAQAHHAIRARVYGNISPPTEAVVQPVGGDPAEWRHVLLLYEIQAGIGPTLTLKAKIAKTANPYQNGPHGAAYEPVTSAKPATLRFAAGHVATTQLSENYFAGRIDNVAFYNTVLPQTEIDKHFNLF